MKHLSRFFGNTHRARSAKVPLWIAALVAAVFAFTACSDGGGDDGPDPNLGVTWTGIAGGEGATAFPTDLGDSGFGENHILGIAYGGGSFVAVGQRGRMAYSTNGITWTGIACSDEGGANPTTPGDSGFGQNHIRGVAYGGGRFVAVGQNGRMAYSANGTSWEGIAGGAGAAAEPTTPGDSGFGQNRIRGVAYGGGIFVAVGQNGRMAHSTNGTTWEGIAGGTGATATPSDPGASQFGTNEIRGVAYGGGRFVAVGASGRMAYSSNGISWTGIAGGSGATAEPTTPGASQFGTNTITAIAYGGGRFVAVGASGRMAYSSDGISWTGIAGGTGTGPSPTTPGASGFGTNSIQNIAYGGNRFVAVGNSGRMAYSTDGVTWTAIAGGEGTGTSEFGTDMIMGIAYGGNKFVAVGGSGRMAYSPGN